jgi:hypothetical protein
MEIENIQSIINLKIKENSHRQPLRSENYETKEIPGEELESAIAKFEKLKKEESILFHGLLEKEQKYLDA